MLSEDPLNRGGMGSASPRKKPCLLPKALDLLQPRLRSEQAWGASLVGIPGTAGRAETFH